MTLYMPPLISKDAKIGERIYLSSKDYTPTKLFAALESAGYHKGETVYLNGGTFCTEFYRKDSYGIRVYSNGLTFELFLILHEPCNFWI